MALSFTDKSSVQMLHAQLVGEGVGQQRLDQREGDAGEHVGHNQLYEGTVLERGEECLQWWRLGFALADFLTLFQPGGGEPQRGGSEHTVDDAAPAVPGTLGGEHAADERGERRTPIRTLLALVCALCAFSESEFEPICARDDGAGQRQEDEQQDDPTAAPGAGHPSSEAELLL